MLRMPYRAAVCMLSSVLSLVNFTLPSYSWASSCRPRPAAFASRSVTAMMVNSPLTISLAKAAAREIAKAMAALVGRAAPDISIIGHTDTLGSAEANEMLGLQRAQLIAKLLAAAGLTVADLTVDTHGEFNLQVKTADETPEPRNRRVEITIR